MKSDLPEPVRGLDLLDLFLVCWMVVAVAITADGLLGDSLGKARFFVVEVAIFLLACAYLRLRKQSLPELLRWNPVPWKVLPGIILAALGSALVLDGLDRLVQLVIPMPGEQIAHLVDELTPATGWEVFLLVLGLGLAAPIAEESLFRGVIQQTLEARTDVTRGVLLTSLIFASLHLQYWWLIQLLLMAVILGYLAWRWDSIIPAVMIHAANNLWSFWITLLPEEELSRFYLWKGQLHPALWAAGIALVAGGLFWSEQQENT